VDYKAIAEQVYLASETGKLMEEMGYSAPDKTYKTHTIMGKTFDPDSAEEYTRSFAIGRV
jgi:nitrate/nitrite transport system substrate-binding protein